MPYPADAVEITTTFNLKEAGVIQGVAAITDWGLPTAAVTDWDAEVAAVATQAELAWTSNVHNDIYSSAVVLRDVTVRRVNADGSTANKAVAPTSGGWTGAGGTPSLPWETALVVSLYSYTPGTFIPNGRRRRGRNYLPPMSTSVLDGSNGGFVTTATRDQALADHAAFLADACGTLGDPGSLNLVVMSRVATHGYFVTDLVCDVRMDSQRLRERKQLPARHAIPYTGH